jgi:hypothetical protein
MTDGMTVLENHGKGTAIIERVSFYGDRHLQFVQAVVVSIENGPLVGVVDGWPPAPADVMGVGWDKRVAAVGARIPPAEGSDRNLVLGMRPTAHTATAAGVQVLYRENGQQYELRTNTEVELLAAKSC